MGLSVYTYYETFKPHFSFRFKVDFLSNPSLYRLVQDIKLPTISINASDGRKRFGQTQIVLPFFEFGDQEIEITFIETDDMKVLDYMTNHLAWPNSPQTEDIIVTEYDDTLRNVLKRTLYTITLFSYSAPQWQNSGSPSNMTLTATYIVRKSRDITKDEYDLYNLPIYSPVVDMVQDMNVIGSSVDEGSAESEWQKFLGSLKDEESEQGRGGEKPKQEGTQTSGSSNSNIGSEPVRYKQQNGTLQSLIKSGKLKDAKGNNITDISQLKSGDKLYVDGHEYKAVKYGNNWSLNSNVKGKDYSYERHANNPEEAYQNVTANGAVPYNLGAKSDGCIADGLDCMGYAGVVLKAVGAKVVDKNGKVVSNDVGSVFKNYSTQSFLDKGLKVVGPNGVDMKVLVAAKGGTGHIVIEYNGYIYESAGSSGVRKTEKSIWEKNYKGKNDYKNVMA